MEQTGSDAPRILLVDDDADSRDGKTGFQFRHEQMKDARLAAIFLVVYSGHPDIMTTGGQLGAAACLQKPIEIQTLLDVIGTCRSKQ